MARNKGGKVDTLGPEDQEIFEKYFAVHGITAEQVQQYRIVNNMRLTDVGLAAELGMIELVVAGKLDNLQKTSLVLAKNENDIFEMRQKGMHWKEIAEIKNREIPGIQNEYKGYLALVRTIILKNDESIQNS